MSDVFSYYRSEIDRALEGRSEEEDNFLRLKIIGERGHETRWLNVSPENVRKIRNILAGDE